MLLNSSFSNLGRAGHCGVRRIADSSDAEIRPAPQCLSSCSGDTLRYSITIIRLFRIMLSCATVRPSDHACISISCSAHSRGMHT